MVARVAALHHGILLRRPFHIAAGQVVEQHIELGRKQLSVTLLEMLFQRSLVRQEAIQAAIQTRIVDLGRVDAQQIVQRGGGKPALFDGQLAARRAQTVDGQQRRHLRPRHVGIIPGPVQHRREEVIQFQSPP